MAEAIALAADRDGRGAVKQPVEERRGERRVGEDLVEDEERGARAADCPR